MKLIWDVVAYFVIPNCTSSVTPEVACTLATATSERILKPFVRLPQPQNVNASASLFGLLQSLLRPDVTVAVADWAPQATAWFTLDTLTRCARLGQPTGVSASQLVLAVFARSLACFDVNVESASNASPFLQQMAQPTGAEAHLPLLCQLLDPLVAVVGA